MASCSERDRQAQLTEHRTIDKGHGRITTRHLQASRRLAKHLDWPGVQQVCRIERITIKKKPGAKPELQETTEVAYAITSLAPRRGTAEQLLAPNGGHWGGENRLHWVHDVCFGEDQCRAKIKNCPQNLAAFRNVGLSLLRFTSVNAILSTLRDFASRPDDLLKFLGILKH